MAAFSKRDDATDQFNICFQPGDPLFFNLCEIWPELRKVYLQHSNFTSANLAVILINDKMEAYRRDEKWFKFVVTAFQAASLPEVTESQLETGTYTNLAIAEMLRGEPEQLLALLMGVSEMGSPAEKRSILSSAVEMTVKTK